MVSTCQKSVGPLQGAPTLLVQCVSRFALGLVAAILAGAFILYFPALNGGFIFDDLSLPLSAENAYHPASWLIHQPPDSDACPIG